MIKLICLDLDDTLWPVEATLRRAEARFYAHLQQQAPALCAAYTPAAMREHRLQFLQQRPELRHDVSRWRLDSLTELLQRSGHGEDSRALAAAAFEVFLEARHQVDLFENCEQVLTQLAEEYQLIGLTNGNADLRRLPAGRHFLECFRAEQLGASKPAPMLFHAALNRAACSPRQAVHIGDHIDDDIGGAKAVGMYALQACLTEKAAELSSLADGHFDDWRQLPDLIKSLY